MRNNKLAPLRSIIILFVILNGVFISGKTMLHRWQISQDVILIANMIVFLVTLVSFLLLKKSIDSPNPQSFVRAMYISFIVKFFVVAIAAFVYIMITKENVNKYGLIAGMFLYLVYTFMEVSALRKLLMEKKNV